MSRNCFLVALLAGLSLTCFGSADNGNPAVPIRSFSLRNLDGQTVTYQMLKDKITVVVFVSTRCPISNAFNFRLNALYTQFSPRVEFAIVDSNVNESAAEVRAHAKEMEYDFPIFMDLDNAVADLLGAKATPDSFVIDGRGAVIYHGYIEDALNPQRSKNPALRLAIESALAGRPVALNETHARGCAIRRARPVL